MKNFEEGSKKRKNDFKDKYKKDKGHSNKNFSDKDFQINNNSNKNDIFYEKTIPIHCFDCYFTPRLKIIFPEIIDSNSAIKIKYECPNEHKKAFGLQEFLELTQKHSISNIKCSKCNTNNNTSEISYSKISKGFICKKCAEKYYSQYFLIPFEFLDSTCSNHGLNNPNKDKGNNEPKKEIKFNNNIEMKKGDWICNECGTINFQKRNQCFKCGYEKSQNKVSFFCQIHLENVCGKCASFNSKHNYERIPNISKQQVDKIYDMLNESKNYIDAIEENFNELIKNADPNKIQSITGIFNKFKNENMNLIQLIKLCILSYKQHFFNKDLGINTIYNLFSLGEIYSNDYIKKENLILLEKYLLNPCNYIINNKKIDFKDKKYKELATFYHKDNNNIPPLRENDLWQVEKKQTIKTDSSVFKIYSMPSGKFLVIFGKLYIFDHASIYNSKFEIIKKCINMGPNHKEETSIINYEGVLLINEKDDLIYYNEGILNIFSVKDYNKSTQELKAFKADTYKDYLIIFDKDKNLINIYTYIKNGVYGINNNYNIPMSKPVEEIKMINDKLIYINNSESISYFDINTKVETIITKGAGCAFIYLKIIYDNIIIAYGKNSREILMIGIEVPEIIQKYEIGDCYYCGKVDETSFLVQDKMYLNLFSFESNILQLIGKYEFKCNFDNRLLCIPNRRFILYKKYDYKLYKDDKFPDESYTNDFHIYSF